MIFQPLEGLKEARRVVVLLHLAVAGERVSRHLGKTELSSSDRLLALLTFGRPLAIVHREPVVSHLAAGTVVSRELGPSVTSVRIPPMTDFRTRFRVNLYLNR